MAHTCTCIRMDNSGPVTWFQLITRAEGTESRNAVRFFFGFFWGRASDWLDRGDHVWAKL